MANNFSVSAQTANFVSVLNALAQVSAQMSDAVVAAYGEEQHDAVIDGFYTKMAALRYEVKTLLVDTIDNNLSDLTKTNVI